MANAGKLFDQLILDRARNSLTVLSQGQPLLQGATAEVGYRFQAERRRLSLLGRDSTCTVGPAMINLSRANNDVELEWHVAAGQPCGILIRRGLTRGIFIPQGERVEMWLGVSNIGPAPLQIDELAVLTVAALEGGSGFRPPCSQLALLSKRLAVLVACLRSPRRRRDLRGAGRSYLLGPTPSPWAPG